MPRFKTGWRLSVFNIDNGDALAAYIASEEGQLLGSITRLNAERPEYTSPMMLALMPYLAAVEKDLVFSVRRTLAMAVQDPPSEILHIRNEVKLVEADGVSRWVTLSLEVVNEQRRRFRTDRAFSLFRKTDLGITYLDGYPIDNTFADCRFLKAAGISQDDPEQMRYVGELFGKNAWPAIAFSKAKGREVSADFLKGSTFEWFDLAFGDLRGCIKENEETKSLITMLLLQIACRLSSVFALYNSKAITDMLEIKMIVLYLYHSLHSIDSLLGYMCSDASDIQLSDETRGIIGGLFSKGGKKVVKSLKPLRDAFLHYDFAGLVSDEELEVKSVDGSVDLTSQVFHLFEPLPGAGAYESAKAIGDCAVEVVSKASDILGIAVPALGKGWEVKVRTPR